MTEPDLHSLKIDRSASSFRRRRGWGGLVGWLVVLAVLGGALFVFRVPLLEFVDGLRLPKVSVLQVSKQSAAAASAVSGTAANGYVVAAKRAALSADTPGRIVEMNVTEGSVVKKGQVVARLYAEEYRAALLRAEKELEAQRASVARARVDVEAAALEIATREADVQRAQADIDEQAAALELAKAKLERAEKMLREKIWDAQTVDNARAELVRVQGALDAAQAGLRAARAASAQSRGRVDALQAAVSESEARVPVLESGVALARATLDKTEVRAPFDGIVVLKDAEVGEVVTPNGLGGNARGSVATMVDWSSLEVQVELPETSLEAAVVGENARIYLDAYPDRAYAGHVQRIWPTANRQKATVEVRVAFDAPDTMLRPEMGARVVFAPKDVQPAASSAEATILIPLAAVVSIEGAKFVFVLERDVARARAVKLGEERGGRVLVQQGLSGGERIVAQPPYSLKDGDRVHIQE